ncbi:MAG: alpha/beta fold hydrolase [Tepidisphaeraceae bacterium]|jgi:pimeloyl-ACP methyl ester carboxylesterase
MNQRLMAWMFVLLVPGACLAAEFSVSVPLKEGRLSAADLQDTLERGLHLPPTVVDFLPTLPVEVDIRGINDWVAVRAVNRALGDAFHLTVADDALLLRFDPRNLPRDWDQTCDALDRFTQVTAPEATARLNRRFGLHLPRVVDSQATLVVLIHGLDGSSGSCADLAELLRGDGFQTATFAYPSERPLEESAALFTRNMLALHERFPDLKVDLVAESMGGLIARRYVESAQYAGGVDHFILIAPPNSGSTWTKGSLALKLIVNSARWMHDPDWSPAWMITEGICQASADLRPDSTFLLELNSQPRRGQIRYTIIAGDRPAYYRFEAKFLEYCGDLADGRVAGWWGVGPARNAMESGRQWLLRQRAENDGPVALHSARLAGVSDFVALPADHLALYETVDGQQPAAWPIIHNRLTH